MEPKSSSELKKFFDNSSENEPNFGDFLAKLGIDKTSDKPHLKDRTSLLHEYNLSDPYLVQAGLVGTQDKTSETKNEKTEDDRKPCTVGELAKILAQADINFKLRKDENERVKLQGKDEVTNNKDVMGESSAAGGAKPKEESTPKNKEKKRKKKKKRGYEPKKVPIVWSDPRNDPDFEKELEKMMMCDAFEVAPKSWDLPIELDSVVENFAPPLLPRQLVSMIAPKSEKEFADWEYSIKLEKGECTDSEESEVEDFKTDFDELKEELEKNEELRQKASTRHKVETQLDVSEFMKVFIPPVVEDIIAVRDDVGNVVTYESILRQTGHLSKEYERVYLGLESDSEEEQDEIAEENEIGWEKDHVRSLEIVQPDSKEEVSEAELQKHLDDIVAYLGSNLANTSHDQLSSSLEAAMDKSNQYLDSMGIPQAGLVQLGEPLELMKEEVKKMEHILKAHEGKICPPGTLEVEISSEDEDDVYYRNLASEFQTEDGSKGPLRPPQLPLKFNMADDLNEEIPTLAQSTSHPVEVDSLLEKEPEKPVLCPPLFDAEYDSSVFKIINEKPDTIPDLFAGSDSSDDENFPELTEDQEILLDEEFKKEYFRRGGTVEGLVGSDNEDEDTLELENLQNFSKKFLSFPYASKYSGKFNFVRARRVIAQNFPELREIALSDLKSTPLHLNLSNDLSSDSSDSEEESIAFKAEPFDLEDIMKKPPTSCQSCSRDENWLSADENEDSDTEPITPPSLSLQELQKCSEKRKKTKNTYKKQENLEKSENISATWAPINKFEKPTYESALNAMKQLNKLFKPSSKKFKRPKNLKSWLKGEFNPSRDDIKEWKQLYLNHFGDVSILDKIISPEKQEEYEKFLQKIEDIPRFDDSRETNQILIFKRLLEEKKLEKEHKEKADEIMSSYDFYASGTSEAQNNENPGENVGEIDDEKKKESEETLVVDDKTDGNSTLEVLLKDDENEEAEVEEERRAEPPRTPRVVALVSLAPQPRREEWAEELNCSLRRELAITPAIRFAFPLDGFQREAIESLEKGYNVFVSAHTSAGKTVVAEYAIAMSKRNRSKAVYTSPVKALSNQKYADFKRIFGSVGLITGDTQLNENAECLIMTTEILRSMLYNSSEKIRDLEFVVFDEVHYINDPERGHVWEEVLILLPSQVQIVMLSATVPNTLEFANWVGRTKQRKVMVCATQHRPVPLNHYIYTGTGCSSPGEVYLLKSGDGLFNLQQYQKSEAVMKKLQETERENKKKAQMKRMEEEREWKRKGNPGKPPSGEDHQFKMYKKDQTMWIALISFLSKKDWLPAVCFVFSRKKCDTFAEMLQTVDLTTKSEKSFIHKFIKSQVEKLDEVDQDLPQINIMKRQLDRGIGVHHSGILPVLKEIVEVLFQEGKVKLLFATETFAMGVNMPARTVVFHTVRKFDGNETRLLQPAEYVQMAGRAGRRGKDSAGNVIILAKPQDIIARHDLETLLFGNPCKLISKFRLSYRMILNTLTVSGMLTVQNMMERSFCENTGQMKKKFLEKDLIDAERVEKSLKKSMNSSVDDMIIDILAKFYDLSIQFIDQWFKLRVTMITQSRLFRDLLPGKLIKICSGSLIQRTAMVIESEQHPEDMNKNVYKVMVLNQTNDFERTIAPDGRDMTQEELEIWYRMISLMNGLPNEMEILSGPNDYTIVTIKCHNIVGIFKENLKLPRNMFEEFVSFVKKKNQHFGKKNTSDAGDSIAMHLYGVTGKYTVIDETSISYDNFDFACQVLGMWSTLEEIKKTSVSSSSPLVMKALRKVFCWKQALRKVQNLRQNLSAENMTLYPDFMSKMELLKEKGYVSNDEQVQMKGYMAARIGKYELIVCELLVENVLVGLSPEETAAFLSFLVYQSSAEDSQLDPTLPPTLLAAIKKCKVIMHEVTTLERKYDIRDFEGSEISKLKFGLVPIMYAWAKQEPLKNIMEMASDFEFQEGLLVRWIQQLLETLKEVESAARLMGDPGVPAKLQAAGQSIKRGIVFAPSLYTTMM